jgi:hypothetical protein
MLPPAVPVVLLHQADGDVTESQHARAMIHAERLTEKHLRIRCLAAGRPRSAPSFLTAPDTHHHERRSAQDRRAVMVSSLVSFIYVRLRSSVFGSMCWRRSRTLTVFGELSS